MCERESNALTIEDAMGKGVRRGECSTTLSKLRGGSQRMSLEEPSLEPDKPRSVAVAGGRAKPFRRPRQDHRILPSGQSQPIPSMPSSKVLGIAWGRALRNKDQATSGTSQLRKILVPQPSRYGAAEPRWCRELLSVLLPGCYSYAIPSCLDVLHLQTGSICLLRDTTLRT